MDNLKPSKPISYLEAKMTMSKKALVYALEQRHFYCAVCGYEKQPLLPEGEHLRCACCGHAVQVVQVVPAKEYLTDPYQTIELIKPEKETLPLT